MPMTAWMLSCSIRLTCTTGITSTIANTAIQSTVTSGIPMALYRAGMREARRVLRGGATLWVKCKDENDGKQNWAHITIHQIGQELGFQAVDLFVLASRPRPHGDGCDSAMH